MQDAGPVKKVLVVHPGSAEHCTRVEILGRTVHVDRRGCGGEIERARALIARHDGVADVIALEGIPAKLQLGSHQVFHRQCRGLFETAGTEVVDGSGIRPALERWGVMLAERAQPGIFTGKRTLMVPGLNHSGLAHALSLRTHRIRYADSAVFFGIPRLPGIGNPSSPSRIAVATLRRLSRLPVEHFVPPPGTNGGRYGKSLFRWAEVLAGDLGLIRRIAPQDLKRKIVVTECAEEEDLEDLRRRGATCLVTLMPPLAPESPIGRFSAAAIEAMLVAARRGSRQALSEDVYLDMISEIQWVPAVRYLQAGETGVNKFAFVIHPLHLRQIYRSAAFRWARFFPDSIVEAFAARVPPFRVSRITGAQSPTTGQRIEGELIALGATPRQMMNRSTQSTYRQLTRAARIAERGGARIMGLGAFTSVIGDAGVTVARQAPIAITSGNSLTVAATLEAAKQAAIRMGADDVSRVRAMIVGATGSIGSVCARMIAQATRDVVLVSIEPEKLIDLKRTIRAETPESRVTVATRAEGLVGECDLIVTATSAFGQRILDISQCKPGAIVCDVARPPDINEDEAALRPDVLVIESGEVMIPGDVNFHFDIGLPPGVSYACLAETALLAMEGRFESFTLGRKINIDRVKEIYRLFKKHDFRLAGLRSLGRYVTEEELAGKRELAERLRRDAGLFEKTKNVAARRMAEIPVRSKGVEAHGHRAKEGSWLGNSLDALALWRGRTKTHP
jgi:predicted amino acid dehydrogenase